MRLVFAGTPEVALPSLNQLVECTQHEVVAVVTQPDSRRGRGRQEHRSPVAARAAELGIPLLQPVSAADQDFVDHLTELKPDCCPIVAYGQLLTPGVLAIPRLGWVNLHFSLLPQWRGAAPIQAALRAGDEMTGATTFLLDEGMDSGPIIGSVTEPIFPSDTAGDLLERCAQSGARLLIHTLDALEQGHAQPRPQPLDGVSYTAKITTEDARISWNYPAHIVSRHIHAMTPQPGAWTMFGTLRVKVGRVAPLNPEICVRSEGEPLSPGQLMFTGKELFVGTAGEPLEIIDLQPSGKKTMQASDWARGVRLQGSEVLA